MVNTKGGREYKRYKHRSKENVNVVLVSKSNYDGSIYAKVDNLLGNNMLSATGENKIAYRCVIRGRLMNKDRMCKGDYIIILPRDFEKRNFADICHKCNQKEVEEYEVDRLFDFYDNSHNDGIIFDTSNTINEITDNNQTNEEFEFDKL